jgi:hypothetical protein
MRIKARKSEENARHQRGKDWKNHQRETSECALNWGLSDGLRPLSLQ